MSGGVQTYPPPLEVSTDGNPFSSRLHDFLNAALKKITVQSLGQRRVEAQLLVLDVRCNR